MRKLSANILVGEWIASAWVITPHQILIIGDEFEVIYLN